VYCLTLVTSRDNVLTTCSTHQHGINVLPSRPSLQTAAVFMVFDQRQWPGDYWYGEVKWVCLNARSMPNNRHELNIMVEDISDDELGMTGCMKCLEG